MTSFRESLAPLRHWPASWPYADQAAASSSAGAMVATTDEYATAAGLQVLRDGGNAVDAAVAAAFALAVVNPEAGNLGGGGFMLIHTADGAIHALDYRSTAPAAASRDMFLDVSGKLGDRSVLGHLSVAVPGSVRGMWDAHERFGRLGWPDLVEPAVELARGFVVRDRFVQSFEPHIVEELSRFPASALVFLPGGRPPVVGATFRQVALARTLERIRDQGTDGFYRGECADLIVAEMVDGNGIVTHEDLASYRTIWREPTRFDYRRHTVVSMPPPSSGGITLTLMANVLSEFSLAELPWHGPEHLHLLAEAWKRAFADRNHYLADPEFTDVPFETLGSRAYARARASDIVPARATPSGDIAPGVGPPEGRHTTHVSVVDAEGNAVSLTTTINTWYGSKVLVPGVGVMMNNDMDDFSADPGSPNFFGLVQGEANKIEPGKRMLSAMTPTIVLDGEGALRLVLGAPGGATIITTVFQIISNILDHDFTLDQAVRAPRIHHQHVPDEIRYEPNGMASDVVLSLVGMGHRVVEHDEVIGDAQAILVTNRGTLQGCSDPRRGGVALGF